MKRITLTQGKYALVSDKDYSYLNQWKWHAHKHKQRWYAERSKRLSSGRALVISMHRLILGLQAGDSKQGEHKDGDGLNNTRRNLRVASKNQNEYNRSKRVNNKSGLKGVHKVGNRWVAYIGVNGEKVYLGCFSSPQLAFKAYKKAARKYHKTFANFS